MPHRRPPAVLAFIFYREKGSAVPVPRQHQSRISVRGEKLSCERTWFGVPSTYAYDSANSFKRDVCLRLMRRSWQTRESRTQRE